MEDMKSKGKEEFNDRDSIILDAGKHSIVADIKIKNKRKCCWKIIVNNIKIVF